LEVGFLAKYSYEFKKEVVKAYLDGKGGYKFLAKKFGIPSPTTTLKKSNFLGAPQI
jgi:transposase-like protein